VELDWLETFLAVVDRGGFTAASAQVHRSQSRVSAHIAALERELGVQLIDRGYRPAKVTEAGRVFATHARDIIADVGIARSAIAAVRALSDQSITVHTTPGFGATMFPSVLAGILHRHPDATITLAERDWPPVEPGSPPETAVLAVAPVFTEQHPPARRRVLWWERLLLLVPDHHEWARSRASIRPEQLADRPLVACASAARALGRGSDSASGHGTPARVRLTIDCPQTLPAMVRAGLGVGITAIGSRPVTDLSGLTELEFAGSTGMPPPGFDVALDWFDLLLTSPVGRDLHAAVLAAPAPAGAVDRRSGPVTAAPA
jgi:DNA-binding transcriptional LysR family regulator